MSSGLRNRFTTGVASAADAATVPTKNGPEYTLSVGDRLCLGLANVLLLVILVLASVAVHLLTKCQPP